MSSVKTQPNLRVHVLCSGIRYGNGERTFYDHFQKAWIQNPQCLPVIGDGKNLVPTIHVRDLASLVRRVVIENAKEHPYIFAIDKTPNPTQKRIVQAISKGMGTGLIENVSKDSISEPWVDFLAINLKMKASSAFATIQIKDEDQIDPDELEKLKKQNEFPWHTEKGIVKKISVLNDEFNQTRGLKPVKIIITGPPASGKTFYADKLAKYYNIPKVNVGHLLSEVWRFTKMDEEAVGDNEQIQAIRAKVDELREAEIAKM
jgi:adenylate kinase